LVVLDAHTGALRWSREGLQPGTIVRGDEQLLYLITPDRTKATAFRPLDGKELLLPNLHKNLRKAVAIHGKDLLLADHGAGGASPVKSRKHFALRMYDPLAEKDLWKLEVPTGTLVSSLNDEQLALLDPSGQFRVLELGSGQARLLGTITPDEFRRKSEAFAFSDHENVYLVVNEHQSPTYYSEGMASLSVHGTIRAYDARQGGERWRQKVGDQNLILECLDYTPVLVFASRKYEGRGDSGYWSLAILAIDKRSGRKLLNVSSPSQSGFQSMSVNLAEKFIELRSYNERVRLVPKTAAAITAP
jgi:hypothetical protein